MIGDSIIENATLQDGTLTIASGQLLTLYGLTLDNITLSGGTVDLDGGNTSVVSTDSTIEYARLQDGTLGVTYGQTLTLDGVTFDGVILLGGIDSLDGATSTVSTDSSIQYATLQNGTLAVAPGQTLTLDGATLDNVTMSGGTDDLDGGFSVVNTDSTIQYATLQNGTLAVAPGQTLILDSVALDDLVLLGGTDDLGGSFSVVNTDSTIQYATLQNGTLAVASGQTLTLDGATLEHVVLLGGTDDLDGGFSVVNTDSAIQYATLQDGTLAVASGQMLTLESVTLDNVILLGGTDDLDGTTSTVSTDSTIQYATLEDGTLVAASGQTLTLNNTALSSVILSGGTDDLDGATSTVSTDTTVQYATIQDGILVVAAGEMLTLDTVTLEASAAIVANGVVALATGNAIENAGLLEAAGSGSGLLVDATTLELLAYGTVTLASGGAIVGNGSAGTPDTLENVDNTIIGSGTIGDAGNGQLALINDISGTIEANGGTLTLDTGNPIVNAGLLQATASSTLDIMDNVKGTGNIEISNGATVELGGTTANLVTFGGSTGTLQIDTSGSWYHYSIFGGGALLPAGDEIYLPNISYDAAADSYNANTGVITVSNGTADGTVMIDVVGGISYSDTFVFESQGSGTLVYDPPVGTNVLDPQARVSATSVSAVGDTFVFHPGMGAETAINFIPTTDTIQLDHFANFQSIQQLTSLIATDAHGDAVIELGHHDSITLPGVSANYLQSHLHSLVHLI